MAVDLFLGSPKSINIMIPFFLFKTWLSEKKKMWWIRRTKKYKTYNEKYQTKQISVQLIFRDIE